MNGDDEPTKYGVMQFQFRTITPGGHPGSDVFLLHRPDGVWLRLSQGGGEASLDVFLDLEHCERLADELMTPVWEAQMRQRRDEP